MKMWIYCLLLLIPFLCEAKYDVTPACYKNLETSFFDPNITQVAFSLYDVNQGSWDSINNDIKKNTEGIHQRLWAKGRKLQRNPLDNKYEPAVAAQLLRDELYEIFDKSCRENFVTSQANIKAMFNYIEYRQASKIQACFGRDTFIEEAP